MKKKNLKLRTVVVMAGLMATAVLFHNSCMRRELTQSPSGRGQTIAVDDFEDGDQVSSFKTPWGTFTDQSQNGRSTASIRLIGPGARQTGHALEVTGQIAPDFPFGFAGMGMYFSAQPLREQDLTGYAGIRFYTRGDGGSYQVQILCRRVTDHNEFGKTFFARDEWTLIEAPFTELAQSPWWGNKVTWSGKDIIGVSFRPSAGARASYRLEVDELEFY